MQVKQEKDAEVWGSLVSSHFCPKAAMVAPACKICLPYSGKTFLAIADAGTKCQTILAHAKLLSLLISRHHNVLIILSAVIQTHRDVS